METGVERRRICRPVARFFILVVSVMGSICPSLVLEAPQKTRRTRPRETVHISTGLVFSVPQCQWSRAQVRCVNGKVWSHARPVGAPPPLVTSVQRLRPKSRGKLPHLLFFSLR